MATVKDLIEDWIEKRSTLQRQLEMLESGQMQMGTHLSDNTTSETIVRIKTYVDGPPWQALFLALRTIWSAAVICPASVCAEHMSAGLDEDGMGRAAKVWHFRRCLRNRWSALCCTRTISADPSPP